jgi:4-amino-4-deoxy-L-arabinose transferase-like glycosyltransferase
MATISVAPERALRRPAWVTALCHPVLLLSALCLFLFFHGLSAGELYRTENLRAIIAGEFLRSGDWIVPRLYGEPLFTKPPGTYAAIAAVSWPFGGVTEWTARLPSAIAATLTVFLFYWYFSRQLGRFGGLVAAMILPLSVMWLDKAPSAEIDMMQVMWVSAAVIFFLRAIENREISSFPSSAWERTEEKLRFESVAGREAELRDRHSQAELGKERASDFGFRISDFGFGWWLLSLLCVAGGVLTKWTAPVFFYATVVTLLWRRRQLRLLWSRYHLISAAVAAGICLAWIAAAVYRAGWHEFYGTVSREAFQRIWPPDHYEAQKMLAPHHDHSYYPWRQTLLHPLKLWAMNLPWSAFALVTLWPGFARQWGERGRRLLQALHCWVWPNLFFWSIIPEHASRHSAPLFPGIAGLAAMVWIALLSGKLQIIGWALSSRPTCGVMGLETSTRPTGNRWRFGLMSIVACWLVVKLVFIHVVIPQRNPARAPKAKGEQLAALVPPGKTLYLFHLKDEGIMFYYSRQRSPDAPPVLRLHKPAELPSSDGPVYCILEKPEWDEWSEPRRAEALLHLEDEQKAPIVLVRVSQ